VRPRDTSKQRLRLGTSRYCGGGWNAATNPGSDPYTTNNGDSLRPGNANTDTSSHTYTEFTSSHTHADASSKSDAYSV
jgi:hypothetical protein